MKKFVALFAVLGLWFAACGDSGSDSADTSTTNSSASNGDTSAGGTEVTIADFAFDAPASVPIGTTVDITNNDGATHTFTASDGSFDTGNIGEGNSAKVTFENAGTVDFVCKIHPSMSGSITVEG